MKQLSKRLTISSLSVIVILVLTCTPFAAEANHGHPGRPAHPGHPEHPGQGRDFLFVPLNQYLRGNNILAVRQILNLGPQYRGRSVDSVVLRARTDFGRGQAQLLVNNAPVGFTQTVGTRTQEYYFQLNPGQNTLDQAVHTLQISLQGQFTVEGVGVNLAREWETGETRMVRRQFSGRSRLDLAYLFTGFENRPVRSITIVASTAAGRGQAQVCSTQGPCSGQPVTVRQQLETYQLPTQGIHGRLGALYVDLMGNFWIESVTVDLDRFGH